MSSSTLLIAVVAAAGLFLWSQNSQAQRDQQLALERVRQQQLQSGRDNNDSQSLGSAAGDWIQKKITGWF